MKINKVVPDSNPYLKELANIDNKPQALYYLGEIPKQRQPTIAIVGTRKPTSYGVEVTSRLASELTKRGFIIVSGLALGTDALAHRACLDAGGTTIAIIPSQLPNIYPRSNSALARRIVEKGGAVLSEHSVDDTEPYILGRWSFLERNRLVSGVADAVLITEASKRSGTLNTAAHALAQGKDVFVVPGNITSPQSAGCNALIKQGATPVTCAEDIISVVAPEAMPAASQPKLTLGTTPAETVIIEQLARGIRDGDELQKAAKLSATEFSTALTMLELSGAIRSLGANQWTLL